MNSWFLSSQIQEGWRDSPTAFARKLKFLRGPTQTHVHFTGFRQMECVEVQETLTETILIIISRSPDMLKTNEKKNQ
jgi:hypothetical protein